MTLGQWQAKYGIQAGDFHTGAKTIPDVAMPHWARIDLYSLSDYFVSSVTAGTIWLSPR